MRKIVLFGLFAFFSLTGLQAQVSSLGEKRIDVFVYADPSVTTPLNALRAELTHELVNSADSCYIVTDRTEEIWKYLRQELDYQESGYVRDDQLIKIGEHFGASYLCAVGVTNYQEYNEFFFEGTVVDIAARTIKKHSQYPDDGSKVEKLDPRTQIRVGKELAKQLGLFSSEQLAAERRKQLLEKEARERAEKEARGLQIGDVYEGIKIYGNSFRIGYLDATGKHGIAFRIGEKAHLPFVSSASSKLETPTCSQLLLLYKNKKRLGLHDEYWSSEIAKKEVHGFGNANWTYPWYYTIDFSSGKKMKRRTGFDDPHFYNIEIIQF